MTTAPITITGFESSRSRDVNAARRFCEDVLGLERSVDYERRNAEFETGKLTLQDPNGHAWILHHCHAPRA